MTMSASSLSAKEERKETSANEQDIKSDLTLSSSLTLLSSLSLALLFFEYVNREEREYLQQLLTQLARLDPFTDEAEKQLVEILERFDIVPKAALKKALMDWKIKGWQDIVNWRLKS